MHWHMRGADKPQVARLSLLVFGVLLPVTLIVVCIVDVNTCPAPTAPKYVPTFPTPLPHVRLPTGSIRKVCPTPLDSERRTYLSGLCYNCHGRQGKGDDNQYLASIGRQPADHTDVRKMQQLTDWEFFLALRDGVKDERGWLTMPPWESVFSAAQMWDVIAYVRRLPLAEEVAPRHP